MKIVSTKPGNLRLSHALYGLFFLLLVPACRHVTVHKKRVVVIQPFTDFSPGQAQAVYRQLQLVCPGAILRKPVALPASAYYAPRHRYRADSLIRWLSAFGNADTVLIGLTTKDISTTKNGKADWGIMGLGYLPGHACVVSAFRVSKPKMHSQLYKLAVHELGHTQGLPHCSVKTCFMRDAEGGNPLDEETAFCASCKLFLSNRGWNLK
ncbi:Zn-dependent protease [Foetidibacter luteolus]|uniref:Zn-dependent protease n=1 Tax=Foetidibacter luteolus TaxID=2608880 RepID=UPI00129BF8D1|nr:Zn-dependent protease [Foetidibacter luteolus]